MENFALVHLKPSFEPSLHCSSTPVTRPSCPPNQLQSPKNPPKNPSKNRVGSWLTLKQLGTTPLTTLPTCSGTGGRVARPLGDLCKTGKGCSLCKALKLRNERGPARMIKVPLLQSCCFCCSRSPSTAGGYCGVAAVLLLLLSQNCGRCCLASRACKRSFYVSLSSRCCFRARSSVSCMAARARRTDKLSARGGDPLPPPLAHGGGDDKRAAARGVA